MFLVLIIQSFLHPNLLLPHFFATHYGACFCFVLNLLRVGGVVAQEEARKPSPVLVPANCVVHQKVTWRSNPPPSASKDSFPSQPSPCCCSQFWDGKALQNKAATMHKNAHDQREPRNCSVLSTVIFIVDFTLPFFPVTSLSLSSLKNLFAASKTARGGIQQSWRKLYLGP